MTSTSASKTAFQREVATRFGLVPNFFASAPMRPKSSKGCGPSPKPDTSTTQSPHSSRRGCSSTSRGSAKYATALSGIARSWWGEVIRPETPLSPSKALNRRSSF